MHHHADQSPTRSIADTMLGRLARALRIPSDDREYEKAILPMLHLYPADCSASP
jgi:hypothetical protein